MSVHLVEFDVVVELNLELSFIDLGRYNNEAEVNQRKKQGHFLIFTCYQQNTLVNYS